MTAYITAMLTIAAVWTMFHALRIVGVRPESLTQRIIRHARRDPAGTAVLLILVLGSIAYGGGKGPPPRPPIIVHKIPIYQDPVAKYLWPIWRRYHQTRIEQEDAP